MEDVLSESKVLRKTLDEKGIMSIDNRNAYIGQNWVPKMLLQSNMTTEERKKDDYNRRICSILNKITPQNFQKLLMQMVNLNVNSQEKIETIVQFIFRKCMDANLYSEVYANFCSALLEQIKATSTSHASLFSNLLYNEVKNISVKILSAKEPEKNTFRERQEIFYSVIFISQLYNKKVVSDVYIHTNFLKPLLLKTSTTHQKQFEYQLECLCKMLQTIGHKLETQQNKEHANRYFAELENIYKKENISTRTKMLLLNLFELRGNNWFHRMRKERPVTIDQIRSQKGG